MTAYAILLAQDGGFDSLLQEIHQFIEARGGNEVGWGFELRFDIFEENGVAEAAHSLLAEAGIGFPITEVGFREVTDVIAPH